MSISNYLNTYHKDIATESIAAAAGIMIVIAAAIGITWELISEVKQRISAKKASKAAVKYRESSEYKEHKEKAEKYKNSHSKEELINSIKNDARKIVNKLKSDPETKSTIEKYLNDKSASNFERYFKFVFKENVETTPNGNKTHVITIVEADGGSVEMLDYIVEEAVEALRAKYAEAIDYDFIWIDHATEHHSARGNMRIEID